MQLFQLGEAYYIVKKERQTFCQLGEAYYIVREERHTAVPIRGGILHCQKGEAHSCVS